MTAGPDGALWFTSDFSNRIGRITTADAITTFADPANHVANPTAITTGSDCTVWFAADDSNRIGRADAGVTATQCHPAPPAPAPTVVIAPRFTG
jgi:virginiamycin B lyase